MTAATLHAPLVPRLRCYALEARNEFLRLLRAPSFALPTLLFPPMFYVLFAVLFHERAGFHVVEVVVRVGVGVEPAAVVADGKLADESGRREQVQRVVDRGLRHAHALAAQAGEHLLGGKMLGT